MLSIRLEQQPVPFTSSAITMAQTYLESTKFYRLETTCSLRDALKLTCLFDTEPVVKLQKADLWMYIWKAIFMRAYLQAYYSD